MTKTRTLVKLDDTIIEITEDSKGLKAKRISEDDLVEVTLLDEGVEKLIENDVNKLANEAYAELQTDFKTNLKKSVLSILGFENRYSSGWEVDHCNGRNSAITEYISGKIRKMFTDEFDKLIQPEIANMLEPVKKACIKEFRTAFERHVRDQMRSQAQEAAKRFLQEVMDKQFKKFQKQAIAKAEVSFLGRNGNPVTSDE